MSELSIETVRAAIESHPDPETGRPMGKTGQIVEVTVDGKNAHIKLGLSSHSAAIADEVAAMLESKVVAASPGANAKVEVVPHHRIAPRSGQAGLKIKSVILVGSGKGGVGKSTVAASLALSLQQFGSRVGLMDADVYGPSVPQLLGLEGRPAITEAKRIEPIRCGDMPVMSMGFLVERDQAVIWRGPMLHGSINQFLGETEWGELDYLIIDMPPGTGDVALTLSQAVPIAGSVVVCTPQEVALLDAIKAISMFRKVNIPILGMVENMSGFLCPDNGKTYDIFGRGGARAKAEELDVPFLGGLPIDIGLRIAGDEGRLAEVMANDEQARAPMDKIARAVVRNLASKAAAAPAKPSLPTL
ncbi:Mrp/NBP35 family ATP-binding protein [Rubripirellula amarantea]|uniref:Iron-sulfur cluster carrier protein n=1 Tax=Rubripirellula amarantea TaxID=2527999 RepID=A0A5C5WTE2_9BACT|nr:Mrp/NBP35 family ATP-binding protein [Rubripirellula amarantea]MDA8745744.1 Mrp/NBP35 family ATP-binding protein [Rubripirellula amarantea]TWT53425.1 antiporter inner membrane protein [Rubripirellula amarantea]